MKINRAKMLRLLNLAKSVKSNEAIIKDEKMLASSETGSINLCATAPTLESPLGVIDVNLLHSMFGKCHADDINCRLSQRLLKILDGDMEFGYKTADLDIIEVPEVSTFKELDAMLDFTITVKIEMLMRISDLVKTVVASEVTFKEREGELNVIVGREAMFYGKVVWREVKEELKGMNLKFLSSELIPILDVLDSDSIDLGFSCGTNGEKRFLKISQDDSMWYIGVLSGDR